VRISLANRDKLAKNLSQRKTVLINIAEMKETQALCPYDQRINFFPQVSAAFRGIQRIEL
jgi:hypothetical protein